MKNSKIIISLVLSAYLFLLGHLTIPAVNDFLFENPIEHAHPGSGLCADEHNHHTEKSHHEDFHNDSKHHCVYCCGHNNSLQFTLIDNSVKFNKLTELNFIVIEYSELSECNKTESNQIYLQNVFKIPIPEHLISPLQFRAPPVA